MATHQRHVAGIHWLGQLYYFGGDGLHNIHKTTSLQAAMLSISSIGDKSFGEVIFYVAAGFGFLGMLAPPTITSLATLFVEPDEVGRRNDPFCMRCLGRKTLRWLHIGVNACFVSRPVYFPVHAMS